MKGIGVDIVEFQRIREIKYPAKFVDKILSEKEKAVYVTFANAKRQLEYLAGRFAMKEAIYKAIPVVDEKWRFIDFSILNDSSGALYLDEPSEVKTMLTLSHSENYVVAIAVCL